MARAFLPVFVCLCTVAASAQGTPESALAELVLAKDYKSASRHYPLVVVDALSDLPPRDLAVARDELLPVRNIYGTKVTAKASDDASNILEFDAPEGKRRFSLRVKRRVSDGVDAVLELESCEEQQCWGEWRAWMRLEDGEWRLDELKEAYVARRLNLSDPDLIEKLKHAEIFHNEEAALQTLSQISDAVGQYANMFKDAGFPEGIGVLVKRAAKPDLQADANNSDNDDQNAPGDPQHAELLDEALGKDPCLMDGYRFEYTLLRHGPERNGAYSITATPVEFGKTGFRSFYTDENGAVRVTREERTATTFDRVLISQSGYRR